jgi:hypothetical protein
MSKLDVLMMVLLAACSVAATGQEQTLEEWEQLTFEKQPPELVMDAAVRLPPRDYVFVDEAAAENPELLLAVVRESIASEIREAGLALSGYPTPCHITMTPIPDEPGRYDMSCETGARDGDEPDGLLLDDDGRFLQFGIVDFPDSRVYVMVIYAVPQMPYADLGNEARWSLPRVVIPFPQVPPAWYPGIWSLLERAVEATGAKVLDSR